MVKGIMSVIFVLLLVVVGYFVDDGFKGRVNAAIGVSNKAVVATNAAPVMFDTVKESEKVAQPVAGTLATILDKGVVRVSVQSPSKPFYFNENGRPKGFNPEFLNILFAQSEFGGKKIVVDTDHTVETYEDVPKQLLEIDNRGKAKVDIAVDGLTFSDEDLPGVVYSIPYIKDFGYSLITAKGSTIQSIEDTTGKNIGVLKGDPDAKAYAEKTFRNATIIELSDKADESGKWIAGFIKSGKVDAVMYDYPFAVAEIDGTNLQFAIAKLKGSDIQYKIGMRKSDASLMDALNTAIRKAMDTDEYGMMIRKYFSSAKVAAVKVASSVESVYIVKQGDTLSTIAQTVLGNKMRYGEIESRNNLANPNLITVGQKLVIPK